jgi:hypothetical protein
MLGLGQMQCPHLDRERLLALVVSDAQAILYHFFDMRRPHVDKGHVLACARHMRPGIAADRSDTDNSDLLSHLGSPGSIGSDPSAVPRRGTIGTDIG